MNPTRFISVVVILLFAAGSLFAQQQKGDLELQLAAFYFTSTGETSSFSFGSIQTKIGNFFTDELEVGVSPTLTIISSGGETTTTFGSGAFVVYSFLAKNPTTVPYFGIQYYKRDFSNSNDEGNMGIDGGAKFYFTKKAAVDVSANYLFSLSQGTSGALLFMFGLSFLF